MFFVKKVRKVFFLAFFRPLLKKKYGVLPFFLCDFFSTQDASTRTERCRLGGEGGGGPNVEGDSVKEFQQIAWSIV